MNVAILMDGLIYRRRQARRYRAPRLSRARADLPQVRFLMTLHMGGRDFYKVFAGNRYRALGKAKGVRGRLVIGLLAVRLCPT